MSGELQLCLVAHLQQTQSTAEKAAVVLGEGDDWADKAVAQAAKIRTSERTNPVFMLLSPWREFPVHARIRVVQRLRAARCRRGYWCKANIQ